jgi:hypothetical protein
MGDFNAGGATHASMAHPDSTTQPLSKNWPLPDLDGPPVSPASDPAGTHQGRVRQCGTQKRRLAPGAYPLMPLPEWQGHVSGPSEQSHHVGMFTRTRLGIFASTPTSRTTSARSRPCSTRWPGRARAGSSRASPTTPPGWIASCTWSRGYVRELGRDGTAAQAFLLLWADAASAPGLGTIFRDRDESSPRTRHGQGDRTRSGRRPARSGREPGDAPGRHADRGEHRVEGRCELGVPVADQVGEPVSGLFKICGQDRRRLGTSR